MRYGIEAEPWEGNGPCMDCEGRSPFWHAVDSLWDAVMGDGRRDPPGTICPVCFTIRAWAKGIEGQWFWSNGPCEFVPLDDLIQARDEGRADVAQRDAQIERVRALCFASPQASKLRALLAAILAALEDPHA